MGFVFVVSEYISNVNSETEGLNGSAAPHSFWHHVQMQKKGVQGLVRVESCILDILKHCSCHAE